MAARSPLPALIDMRDEVDPGQLWPIITDHLPPLRAAAEALIGKCDG